MTVYPAPLEQKYFSDQADLIRRVRTLETQMAALAAPQLLAKVVLGASAAAVGLPASGLIPQNFTNLRLVICAKSDGTTAAGYDTAAMQFNGATSGYNWNSYYAAQGGSMTVSGGTAQSSMQCCEVWNAHFGSSGRGIATIDIPNYSDPAGVKGFVGLSSASDSGAAGILQTYSGWWFGSPQAITSLTIAMSIGNFVSDSTFCLYGS